MRMPVMTMPGEPAGRDGVSGLAVDTGGKLMRDLSELPDGWRVVRLGTWQLG